MASSRSRRITRVEVRDVRFPTSAALDGSDAMNPDPDYSAAYVILHTDAADGLEGHGLTFTIGRGNELCVAAVEALAPLVRGLDLADITADMGAFWRRITSDSKLLSRQPKVTTSTPIRRRFPYRVPTCRWPGRSCRKIPTRPGRSG